MPYTCLFILFVSLSSCKCQYGYERTFVTYPERIHSPYLRENEQFRQKGVLDYPDRQEWVPGYPYEQNERGRYRPTYRPEVIQDFRPSYLERNPYNPELPEQQARMSFSRNAQNRGYPSPNYRDNYGTFQNKEDFIDMMVRLDNELHQCLLQGRRDITLGRLIFLINTYCNHLLRVNKNFKSGDPLAESFVALLWDYGGPKIVRLPMRMTTLEKYLNLNQRDSVWIINKFEQIDSLWYTLMYKYFKRFIWTKQIVPVINSQPVTENRTRHDV